LVKGPARLWEIRIAPNHEILFATGDVIDVSGYCNVYVKAQNPLSKVFPAPFRIVLAQPHEHGSRDMLGPV
jgi:hypothetical protein